MNLLYVDTCLGDRLTSKAVPKNVKDRLLDIEIREKVAIKKLGYTFVSNAKNIVESLANKLNSLGTMVCFHSTNLVPLRKTT